MTKACLAQLDRGGVIARGRIDLGFSSAASPNPNCCLNNLFITRFRQTSVYICALRWFTYFESYSKPRTADQTRIDRYWPNRSIVFTCSEVFPPFIRSSWFPLKTTNSGRKSIKLIGCGPPIDIGQLLWSSSIDRYTYSISYLNRWTGKMAEGRIIRPPVRHSVRAKLMAAWHASHGMPLRQTLQALEVYEEVKNEFFIYSEVK